MVLDLALRDFHEDFEKPITPPVKVNGQLFDQKDVVVDNCHFLRCTFLNCQLWFAGGPCQFDECQYDAKTTVHLTGAAKRGHTLWERLRKPRPDEHFEEA